MEATLHMSTRITYRREKTYLVYELLVKKNKFLNLRPWEIAASLPIASLSGEFQVRTGEHCDTPGNSMG